MNNAIDKKLREDLIRSRKEYLVFRFRKKNNELDNASYIMKQARRKIARILTEINSEKRTGSKK